MGIIHFADDTMIYGGMHYTGEIPLDNVIVPYVLVSYEASNREDLFELDHKFLDEASHLSSFTIYHNETNINSLRIALANMPVGVPGPAKTVFEGYNRLYSVDYQRINGMWVLRLFVCQPII